MDPFGYTVMGEAINLGKCVCGAILVSTVLSCQVVETGMFDCQSVSLIWIVITSVHESLFHRTIKPLTHVHTSTLVCYS